MGRCQRWVPVCWSIKGNSSISSLWAGEALVTAVLREIRQERFCVKLLNQYVLWMARTQTALLLHFLLLIAAEIRVGRHFSRHACTSRLVIFYLGWSIQHRGCDGCCKTKYSGPRLIWSLTDIRAEDVQHTLNVFEFKKNQSWGKVLAWLKVCDYMLKAAALNKAVFEERKRAGTFLFTLRGKYLTLRLSLKGQVTPNLMENCIEGKRFPLSHWAQSSRIISVTITFPWPSWGYMSPRGVENARTMLWPFDCPEYRRASDVVPISEPQPTSFAFRCPFVVIVWCAIILSQTNFEHLLFLFTLPPLRCTHLLRGRELRGPICLTDSGLIHQAASFHHSSHI